ncbi:type II secretion system F family protein [Pseudomonas sp. NPDC088368]|uniref:type II secretion system F family protein n=1 Tax=Pseudomonas sp. NPDC088368 TaxID=3364453 RepID=UPI0037FFF1E4
MISRLFDVWSSLAESWYSTQFGGKERIQFYESMVALLENGVDIDTALDEIAAIYGGRDKAITAGKGKTFKTSNHPIDLACSGMLMSVRNGKTFAFSCRTWMPPQEASIIEAGEKSGNLEQAFRDCVRIIEARKRITSLVLSTTLYPALLWALMAYLLHVIASRMVPAMARMSNPEGWSGAPYVLYLISSFVNNWGVIALIVVLLAIVISLVSLPYFRGPLRVYLERIPPWSIYKALHGSTFLLNISVMLRSNIGQIEALDALAQNASPWMRERLAAARYGVSMGKNFGVALKIAGHDFPDKMAVQFLCVLATRQGFSDSIHRFSNRWLDSSLKLVELYAKGVLMVSSVAMGSLMVLVLIGTYSMQSNVTTTFSH